MKFSIAATSMLLAAAGNNAAAFVPAKSAFGIQSKSSSFFNNGIVRNRDQALFVLNEDAIGIDANAKAKADTEILSTPSITIEESAGRVTAPPRDLNAARKSTAAYLSKYQGLTGAGIIYTKLVENGVNVVNGYSGGAVLPLLDQFHQDHPRHNGESPAIRWITNSNENSAGHIAEGYAKSAPKLADGKQPAGVVVATSGPGVTNLITPLQDAICDGAPMVVLCGQAATTAPSDAFQAAPAVDLTRPCTKWSYKIKSAAELPYVMDYAFFIARNGRQGPVFVDLPKDLQNQVLDEDLIDSYSAGIAIKGNDAAENYDGVARFMPLHSGANGDEGPTDHVLHLGLPDKGILFSMDGDNSKIESIKDGINLSDDEVKFALDHNPANIVYNRDPDTAEQTSDEFAVGSKLVGKMYNLLHKAKKPLIVAGMGCNECPEELMQFAKAFQIPVATTLHALGAYDERDELALNMVGMHGHPTPNFMTQEADLVICIGSRFDDRITGRMDAYIPEARKAAAEYRGGVIHVDLRLSQKAEQVEPTYFVHSTGKHFLDIMNAETAKRRQEDPEEDTINTAEWLKHKWALEEEYPVKVPHFPTETIVTTDDDGIESEVQRTKMSAQSVVTEMNRQILQAGKMDDCIFSTGVGIHQMVAAQLITWTQPKQMISSGSLGTMGVALGFVIGCKLANGHKMCISVDGDGSFNMTFTELKTVAEQNIPVKLMILDNESQMMVEYWQRLFHDERYLAVTNTVNPNYGMLAQSFGIKNLYCDNEEELKEVMHEFLFADPDEPVLLHARIEKTPCLPLVAPGAPLQDMILEDLESEGGFDPSAAPS
jgi:acetolactate synthase-1/2/3 large subunit